MTKVILNVHGGLVQDVFCSDADIEVTLVDWDTQGRSDDESGIVAVRTHSGRKELACVADYPTNPFSDLPGTDVILALEMAEVHHGQT